METKNKTIKKRVVVQKSVDHLWWRWTTHEGLKTFFGVDNHIELKPGGAFEIYFLMDNPKGMRGSETCKILSYHENYMLSFSWNAPPNHPEVRNSDYKTWVVLYFNSISETETSVELNHVGWPEGETWNEVFNYFDAAWDVVMNRLSQVIFDEVQS